MTWTAIGNHLWQSTLFAVAAWLLTLALKRNRARVRHWVWLVASIKFLLPFSLLTALGGSLPWPSSRSIVPAGVSVIESMSEPFPERMVLPAYPRIRPMPAPLLQIPEILLAICLLGSIVIIFRWSVRARRVRMILRAAVPLLEGREVEALERMQGQYGVVRRVLCVSSASAMEPGVHGFIRPLLFMPVGIADRLTDGQLDAVIAHELTHISRNDNLRAVAHMMVEAIFWFHPLVWWMGTRLVDERERACDEQVLASGGNPKVYAGAILKVCEFYLASPSACVSGITGVSLNKRIEAIMTDGVTVRLSRVQKLLIAAGVLVAVSLPILLAWAQSPLTFEVATIKPTAEPRFSFGMCHGTDSNVNVSGGRFAPPALGRCTFIRNNLRFLIYQAYFRGIPIPLDQAISGGPSWIANATDLYDIEAKAEDPATTTQAQLFLMLQTLLGDRFKLKFHRETRQLPIFSLALVKSGVKTPGLIEDPNDDCATIADIPATEAKGPVVPCGDIGPAGIQIKGRHARVSQLAERLSEFVGRPVVDNTGLKGFYNITLTWTPDPPSAPNLPTDRMTGTFFSALNEQLGLKLESTKGPVETFVIDSAEKPSGAGQKR